jgi:hypothetical protein
MTLADLAEQLRAFAEGRTTRDELQAQLAPVLAADPLDVAESDSTPWDHAHHDARLFWRLVYLLETELEDEGAELRRLAGRVVSCLAHTGSAATTFELLPLIADQERFCTIADKHVRGVISRTGFLSVVAESGYPAHIKLWLQHAGPGALSRLCQRLTAGDYATAAASVERAPE